MNIKHELNVFFAALCWCLIVTFWIGVVVLGDLAAIHWVYQDAAGTVAGRLGTLAGICAADIVWLLITALVAEWDKKL